VSPRVVPGQHTGHNTRPYCRAIATRRAHQRYAAAVLALSVTACAQAGTTARPAGSGSWVTAAAEAMSTVRAAPARDETCRQVLRSTATGSRVRVRLSNANSPTPLQLTSVTAAIRQAGAAVGTPVPLRVKGQTAVTLAPHQQVTSDAVTLPVKVGDDVAVSLAIAGTARLSVHLVSPSTSWCTGPGTGDHTTEPAAAAFVTSYRDAPVVEDVEVETDQADPHGILAVGDSLTDPPLPPDSYQRWTDVLAATSTRPVANVAIGGNRVLLPGGYGPTLSERYARDVLGRPGADTLLVFAGTNDVSVGIATGRLVARLGELCGQARRAGLRVVLVTLAPAWHRGPALERARQAVNAWLRTTPDADVHVDADGLLRDPARPTHQLPAYDLGDGLHLSPAGHRALGLAIAAAL
jgi:lysophospholipase L1-like esterase